MFDISMFKIHDTSSLRHVTISDNKKKYISLLHVYSDIVIGIRRYQTPLPPIVKKIRKCLTPPSPLVRKKTEIGGLPTPHPPLRLTSYVNGP